MRGGRREVGAASIAVLASMLVLVSCSSGTPKAASAPPSTGTGASAAGTSTTVKLDTANPYVYLLSADFTGALQQFSVAEQLGIEAAMKDINTAGGILGREVVLQTQNDQNDPTTAVSLLQQRLSSGKKPDAMYPGGSSAVGLALQPILTQNKILSTDATNADSLNNPTKYPYFFSVSAPASSTTPAAVSSLQTKGYKKIGMIFANNVTGQTTEAAYAKNIKAAGIGYTSVSYSPSTLDMTPQLQQLKAANVDAVIYDAFGTDTLYLIKSRNQMGWSSEPFYADGTAAAYAYAKNMQPTDLKNVFIQTQTAFLAGGVEKNWPLLHHFIDTVKGESGGPASLTANGASLAQVGFNAMQMAALGAQLAKSTDADAVKTALEHLQVPSPTPFLVFGPDSQFGSYNYSSTNHFGTVNPSAYEFVEPGVNDANGLYVPTAS